MVFLATPLGVLHTTLIFQIDWPRAWTQHWWTAEPRQMRRNGTSSWGCRVMHSLLLAFSWQWLSLSFTSSSPHRILQEATTTCLWTHHVENKVDARGPCKKRSHTSCGKMDHKMLTQARDRQILPLRVCSLQGVVGIFWGVVLNRCSSCSTKREETWRRSNKKTNTCTRLARAVKINLIADFIISKG